jgi:hypothetical protein
VFVVKKVDENNKVMHTSISSLLSACAPLPCCSVQPLAPSVTGALFVWLISHQPAVLFSQNKPTTNNQSALLFAQNKSAPVINHQPNEQVTDYGYDKHILLLYRCDIQINVGTL